jgi:hypothetical protein
VSRTVGWFTALFPLVLEARGSVEETLPGVVAALDRVPGEASASARSAT